MMVSDLRIQPVNPGRYKISIDGNPIYARSLIFKMEPNTVPTAEIEIQLTGIDYRGSADIKFYLHPDSIEECASGIGLELRLNDAYRNRLLDAIISVINESEIYPTDREFAESILHEVEECLHTR